MPIQSIAINALLAEATRANDKRLLTPRAAQCLLEQHAPATAKPPSQPRVILADLTIRYGGRCYSVAHLPLALAGGRVLVAPAAGSRVVVTFPPGSLANTLAAGSPARSRPSSCRAASRPSHSGSSTSVGKTLARNPRRIPASDPAMPPVRLLRRTTDKHDEEKAWYLNPLVDAAPEPARQSRTGRTGNGNRRS